jgi:hypothetical protein
MALGEARVHTRSAGWVPAGVAMGICAGSCGPLQHQQLELEPELEVSRVGAEVCSACSRAVQLQCAATVLSQGCSQLDPF